MTDQIVTFLLVLAAGAYLFSALKIANEHERFAVIVMGRFQKLIGPGIVLSGGVGRQLTRIALGQEGRYLGDALAQFSGAAIPVQAPRIATGNVVVIESFRDGKVWVADRGIPAPGS